MYQPRRLRLGFNAAPEALASIILDARFIEHDADHPVDIQEAGKAKGHDYQNGPKNDVSYRVTNIEGAVKTTDWATGTIQQFGFIQDGSVEVIGKYDQGQAERDDRQYDPENDAADRFNYAECASQSADASRGYSDFGQFIHLSKY
ncbi:hypothetical protein [Rhizobium sp. P44RR-XXIV]|uniref:hypothetical protein n=1 Tax=Rhizobium sp. P44RR-XXIV TaxID=1921145 RepID=UPI00145B5180|nr:hypothetical protein [Rhizobium sp. P44RR-XXIV]